MTPRALLAAAWTLVILLLCWTPSFVLHNVESGSKPFFVPNLDKVVHLGIFAVFAFLWMRVGTAPRRAWKVLFFGVALAAISELGQELPIIHRDAGFADGLADSAGVAVGIAASALAARRVSRPVA